MMDKKHTQKAACQLHWRRLPKRSSIPEKTKSNELDLNTRMTRPQLGWGREDKGFL